MDTSSREFPIELEHKPLVVFYQDEGRFGRLSQECKCWVQSKVVPTVKSQMVREYIYAFSALSPQTGDCYSIISPICNTEAMSIFLEEVAVQYSNYRLIMIMDKAGWHTSNLLQVPPNMKVISLPPYSPELNPVELLWREIRRASFHNILHNTLDEVEETLCKELKQYNQSPEKIKSLSKGYNSY